MTVQGVFNSLQEPRQWVLAYLLIALGLYLALVKIQEVLEVLIVGEMLISIS